MYEREARVPRFARLRDEEGKCEALVLAAKGSELRASPTRHTCTSHYACGRTAVVGPAAGRRVAFPQAQAVTPCTVHPHPVLVLFRCFSEILRAPGCDVALSSVHPLSSHRGPVSHSASAETAEAKHGAWHLGWNGACRETTLPRLCEAEREKSIPESAFAMGGQATRGVSFAWALTWSPGSFQSIESFNPGRAGAARAVSLEGLVPNQLLGMMISSASLAFYLEFWVVKGLPGHSCITAHAI